MNNIDERGDGQPSWSADGSGAPVPTSTACSANKIASASMIDPSDFTSTMCSGAHRSREVYARSAVVAAARTHSGFVNGRF